MKLNTIDLLSLEPNALLDLERAKRFYQWSKIATQELLDFPETWQVLSRSLRNPGFDTTWNYLRDKDYSEISAYLFGAIRYHNRIGAWMSGEMYSQEEQHLVESTWRAIAGLRYDFPNVYRNTEMSRLMIESIDPQGLHFAEHKSNGDSELIVALKTGWKCRLRFNGSYPYGASPTIWINLIHNNYKDNPNVIPQMTEFSIFSHNCNNEAQRHFPLLGWLPFDQNYLGFYIENKTQVEQTINDVTQYVNQMIEQLNKILPEPSTLSLTPQ